MKLKICATTGLVFLILNQIMLLQGDAFVQTQKPIDYAHWLLLLGVLLSATVNYIFSDNNFGNIATVLTSLGAIALVGQAVIDFTWWSYGTDYEGMQNLANQVMQRASIRIPFVTIGPAMFYLGLAIHIGKRVKTSPLWAIIAIIGILATGLGSFALDSRTVILIGHVLLAFGMIGTLFNSKKLIS